MRSRTRLISLLPLIAFAISACGPILRLGDIVVPKKEGSSVTLTYPFGPATISTEGVIDRCYLTGPATIKEFATAPSVGPIVRLDGEECDGWAPESTIKPAGKSPGMTK